MPVSSTFPHQVSSGHWNPAWGMAGGERKWADSRQTIQGASNKVLHSSAETPALNTPTGSSRAGIAGGAPGSDGSTKPSPAKAPEGYKMGERGIYWMELLTGRLFCVVAAFQ